MKQSPSFFQKTVIFMFLSSPLMKYIPGFTITYIVWNLKHGKDNPQHPVEDLRSWSTHNTRATMQKYHKSTQECCQTAGTDGHKLLGDQLLNNGKEAGVTLCTLYCSSTFIFTDKVGQS